MKQTAWWVGLALAVALGACGDDAFVPCWERGADACTTTNAEGETIDTRCLDQGCCDAVTAWENCTRMSREQCPIGTLDALGAESTAACHIVDGTSIDYFACERACDSL